MEKIFKLQNTIKVTLSCLTLLSLINLINTTKVLASDCPSDDRINSVVREHTNPICRITGRRIDCELDPIDFEEEQNTTNNNTTNRRNTNSRNGSNYSDYSKTNGYCCSLSDEEN